MSVEHIQLNRGTSAQLFKLPKEMIDYLWERIDVAKKKKINLKENLAGHISHSYKLEDPKNLVVEKLFNVVFNQVDNPKIFNSINEELQSNYKKVCPNQINNLVMKPRLCSLWVNFQKKGEFQPIHNHASLFSFVIWMDIPYHWKDEANLPFSKTNTKFPPGGNFSFLFTDGISKTIKSHDIPMSPNLNGYCCFFPSHLSHQVYPFYTSDKDRISISGNINLKMVDVPQFQQFPFFISNPQVH